MPNYIQHGYALPLEARGHIVFDIEQDDNGLFLRLIEHVSEESDTPGSVGQRNHIYLYNLFGSIANAVDEKGYFERDDLWPAINETAERGGETDLNVSGFVTAVLIDIGFAEAVPDEGGGGYHRGRYRFRQCLRKSPPRTQTASPTRQRQ